MPARNDMERTAHCVPGTRGSALAWEDSVFTAQFILFSLVLAQLADALTFTIGVSRFGIGIESNGMAAALYHISGLGGVLLVKGAVIIAAIAIMVFAATNSPRLLVWGGAAATSLGLLGFAANSASIAILS
jgi:hypothetical protein